jgi:glycosyltransferase XagB
VAGGGGSSAAGGFDRDRFNIAAGPDAITAEPFWLNYAVNGLRRARPEFSAAEPITYWQRCALLLLALAGPVLIVAAPSAFIEFVPALLALPFLCIIVVRSYALWHYLRQPATVGGEQASQALPNFRESLPTYSVLVALHREAEVAPDLVRAMSALNYPAQKIEFLLITEASDDATRAALVRSGLAANMHILTVPEGDPQTKPRALNFALAQSGGDMIAVFDAEDMPHPDQLLSAVAAFQSSPLPLVCVQARLNVYNGDKSLIAQQFMLEYTALFDAILPAIARLGLPVPLGGTSNHFRREALEAAGGWDPFNVTEDADIGVRFARLGLAVGIIDSTTLEEAPVTVRGWFGQRTRWLKGWMQTYLVHMRNPWMLWRELGPKRFFGFQILMGAMIFSSLAHPWLLGATIYSAVNWPPFLGSQSAVGQALWGLGLFNLLASYAVAAALCVATVRRRGQMGLPVLPVFLLPLYWLGISLAAFFALYELFKSPHHWQKTAHSARPVTKNLATP